MSRKKGIVNREQGLEEKAKAPAAAVINPLPKRWNQWRCARCGNYGCPRVGSHAKVAGVTRYRACKVCGFTFSTFQASAGERKGVERVEPV